MFLIDLVIFIATVSTSKAIAKQKLIIYAYLPEELISQMHPILISKK